MTLKNARIYQELQRRLTSAEPVSAPVPSERVTALLLERGPRHAGDRPAVSMETRSPRRGWNGQN